MPSPPQLDTKETEQLAKSKYVKDYNYIANTFGISDGLKLVGASEGEEGKGKSGNSGCARRFKLWYRNRYECFFMIEGVRKTALQESFKTEKVKSLMENQLQSK